MNKPARQFASLRLPYDMKAEVAKMAKLERRSISAMLLILVEEALGFRQASSRTAEITRGAMERYGKLMEEDAQ